MNISLCVIDSFSRSVEISVKTLCYLNEEYSASEAVFHCGQSGRFTVLAKELLMSFTVSVLAKEVGGSEFEVSVSGAPKFRGEDGLGWVKAENTFSRILQFANLTLSKCSVVGFRYRMIEGESYPT